MVFYAICKVQIDKRLIRYFFFSGHLGKIIDNIIIKGNRFFFIKCFCIWVSSWIQTINVVFFSHKLTSILDIA